ncbi:MAG TPA: bifunctional serine/threonine-protein kinase/formylglycine-generating enzyme family protein [Kofleriaceae bacterium]|nr:bifunctional serine/threonine-protein kinase/formylglycine-generating enzyme family protein [Kofleriaceae bacterium]
MPNPQSGSLLGAYRVEGTIGSGSMGEVFRGIDTGLNRRVAIKLLSEKHRDSPELRQRFVREGRAVAAISHPNVVQVFATGSFDDRPYIAMELLDGADLGSIVERNGPVDSLTAAHAVLDAAQGLAAASRAGLIHRDVKPSNLVRLSDGRVKVTDFGLAKPMDPGKEPALTAMGVVVGTPDYIAPEQARGEAIDERVDIYALGGTLYFLLTGVPPFRTGKPAEDKYLKVVARHLRNPAPDAKVTNPACDPELAELARTMMAKKPAERPSYDELIAHASHIVTRLDPAAVPRIVASRDRSRPNTLPVPIARPPGAGDEMEAVANGALAELTARRADSRADSLADRTEPTALPRAGVPGWLIAVSFVCLVVFVAGLVVYLRRAPAAAAPGDVHAQAAPAMPGSAGQAADPTPTSGMVLVRRPDGTPWFYVDPQPVTASQFHQLFARHDQPGAAGDPVVNVSYNEARSYAQTLGCRLLTSDEWDSAITTPGVRVAGDLLEWVESPADPKQVRQRGKTESRPDAPQKDITFRMAMRVAQ